MATSFWAFYPPGGGASNASVGINGQPIPADSTLVAGEDPSGNLQPLQTDVSGNLKVSVQSTVTPQNVNLTEVGGVAIAEGQTTMSASLPVAIASDQSTLPISAASLPLPTGAATASNQTDGSQKSQIVDGLGNVIASTSNALNVAVQGTTPVSGTVTANQGSAGASNWLMIQPDITSSGTITSTQTVSLAINSYGAVGISVTGTWTGTIAVEASVDGTNYNSTTALFLANGQIVSNITANGQYQCNCAGTVSFRVRGNTVASGSATIAMRASVAVASVMLDNSLPAGSATIGAVSQAGTWNITNVSGTVSLPTGASTAANQTNVQSAPGTPQTTAITIQGNASGVAVPVSGTVTATGTVAATQSGTWTVQPGNTANTTPWLVNNAARTQANAPVFNANSSSNITTSAYLQLVASTTSATSYVECYNQSSSSIYFATGAAASEVNQFIIPPGGNGLVPIKIAASTRISVKAVDTNATTGSLIVNFWT